MLRIKQFIFNPFDESTYLIIDEDSDDAIVVDPGMAIVAELDRFDEFIEENKLNIKGIINTHLHLDHCFGANHVKERYGVKMSAHQADAPLGKSVAEQARRFGMRIDAAAVDIDVPLGDGDIVELGNEKLEVIHTPGHTPGGICFYCRSGRFLIAGDTLFKGSIGRTDLVGGSHSQLVDSVNGRLFTLPGDTLVLPGHGPSTTISAEKSTNPFVR